MSEDAPLHTIAVFASDKGPGDPERSSIMSQAGTMLARRGLHIVCLAEDGQLATPLVTSARAAGGTITIVADEDYVPSAGLKDLPIERIADADLRIERLADLSDAFLGLPGSLLSSRALFACWVEAGGGSGGKPVALLNKNRAFEVMRGYALDVLSHSIANADKMLIVSDALDDLVTRMQRVINTG